MTEEILSLENNRDNKTLLNIYFYKDGNSPWYRAYELSAYYAYFYPNNLKETERLHPIKKASKLNSDGIVCVGLQLSSFKKYFPNAETSVISDNKMVLTVKDSDFPNMNIENYHNTYLDWKSEFALKKGKSDNAKESNNKNIYNSPVSFSSIMKEIIRYDTHNKGENELRIFVGTLKDMCAELI